MLDGGLWGFRANYEAIRKATTEELREVLVSDVELRDHLKNRTLRQYVFDNDLVWLFLILCGGLFWMGGEIALFGIPVLFIGILINAEQRKRADLESVTEKLRAIETELAQREVNS